MNISLRSASLQTSPWLRLRNTRMYCFALCCCLLWFSNTASRAITLFYHLAYPGQPWYYADQFLTDEVCFTVRVVTTTTLPPGRYMLADSEKRELWNFERQNIPAPAGTEVYMIVPGCGQPDNYQVGDEYPFGTHDLHAVYLLEYYTRAVVGSAAGGDEVAGAAMVGGGHIKYERPLNYKIAYGDLPLELDNANGSGDTCPGMAQYSFGKSLAALLVTDTPLGYRPPRGPAMDFTVSYNSASAQPASAGFPHFGTHWTFNWFSFVVDDPGNTTSTRVYLRGGGIEECTGFNSSTQSFAPDPYSQAVVVKTASGYDRRLPDGSKEVYGQSDQAGNYPHKTYLTKVTDTTGDEGNSATISYGHGLTNHLRPTLITDALGKHTTIYYDDDDGTDKIVSLSNDFGKTVTFGYTNGRLSSITDPVEIVSAFDYNDDGFLQTLTTPYGPTTFTHGGDFSPYVEATDPMGGRERVEYNNAAGISPTDPTDTVPSGFNNSALNLRNSFYWGKTANGVFDYTTAQITHWLLSADGSFVSRVPSSEKAPLENRVWYLYPGQSDSSHAGSLDKPSTVARMLNPTTPQISSFLYNSLGKPKKVTDPKNRVTSYVYDTNNIDVVGIYQRNLLLGLSADPDGFPADKIATNTYNGFHEPLTTKDAAGQMTLYEYYPAGQIKKITNPKFEDTTYGYGDGTLEKPLGYLTSITSPQVNGLSASTNYTYDYANRVLTVTGNPDNYSVTTYYDDLDRPTFVLYPDETYEEFIYVDIATGARRLDVTRTYHRDGRFTDRHYNGNRQMDSITDPGNRTTLYNWCTCGSLTSITDPKNQPTTFNRDLQGRVYQKVFANGSAINYLFEGQDAPNTAGTSSRLRSSTDALNRRTNYAHYEDNTIIDLTYTDTSNNQLVPPTPSVHFDYDPSYVRMKTINTAGIGATDYAYYPVPLAPTVGAGRLQSIHGSLANDTTTFTYDELGRVLGQSIDGVVETVAYDPLGRMTTTNNALGPFGRVYNGLTRRIQTLTYPNGQSANYSYFGNDEDRRLQTLQNLATGAVNLSRFDYTYDEDHIGQIASWSSLLGAAASGRWFDYDNSRQLHSSRNASDPALTSLQTDYGYDVGANRVSDRTYNPNGSANNGTLNSYPAVANVLNQLDSFTTAVNGHSGVTQPLVYDLAGNLTDDGQGKTFEWDAANRLIAVNYTGTTNRSEFTYDGLSRRVKIVEKTGSTVNSTKKLVWVGTRIAQERDASNVIARSYFAEGEQRGAPGGRNTKNYYYSPDHLGSIREMTNSTGGIEARYDYDPYGKRTKVSGTLDVDFGYTGHYHHAPSGLNLTLYRAYNPALGRWLSRDPLKDAELLEGPNLYAYVRNAPVNAFDPYGIDLHLSDSEYRELMNIPDEDAQKQIVKQNQLLDEGIKVILDSLLDAFNICKKAAVSGKPVVDIAVEQAKKALENKAKEDFKRRFSTTPAN